MPNTSPAVVSVTQDTTGTSVLKYFTAVNKIVYDFYENTINVVDATGSFYFGYRSITTVTHTIANGVTTIVIS